MPTKRIISDDDFGLIIIRTRVNARNISMRVGKEGLLVTVPPYTKTESILRVLADYRQRLLDSYQKVSPKKLDESFYIDAPCFKLSLSKEFQRYFSVKCDDDGFTKICCPADVDFNDKRVQTLLRSAILRAMKKRASEFLPPLLAMWAERYGMTYKKIKITGAKSRWGSCSSRGTISLSCYLMLLPPHLMDYVILHELAHTKEMNHGPEFWSLLNSMTEDRAMSLRTELRKFRTEF